MLQKNKFKINTVTLPMYLETGSSKDIGEDELEGYQYIDIEMENEKIVMERKDCLFNKVKLLGCRGSKSSFVNIRFENCDLSNTSFSDSTIHTVEFIGCKLTGTDFSGCSLRDVYFDTCLLEYSNFNCSTIKNTYFKECKLEEASFNSTECKNNQIETCNFMRAEFLNTPLRGMDFSTSIITGIKVSTPDLLGVMVDQRGALELANLLGIVVV